MSFLFPLSSVLTGASACTILTVSHGQKVFFAGNEDQKPNASFLAVDRRGVIGVVYVATPWMQNPLVMQTGINEKGLSFDVNWIPKEKLNPHPERKGGGWPVTHFMREVATVEEVLSKIFTYNWGDSIDYQIHFADKNGDAAVIHPGKEGELTYTRKPKGNSHLVSSNFNLKEVNEGNFFTRGQLIGWDRYKTADKMLSKIGSENDLTVKYLASVLKATHQDTKDVKTLYSNIYDLQNLRIFLFFDRQFDSPYVLDIANEMTNTQFIRIIDLKELISNKDLNKEEK